MKLSVTTILALLLDKYSLSVKKRGDWLQLLHLFYKSCGDQDPRKLDLKDPTLLAENIQKIDTMFTAFLDAPGVGNKSHRQHYLELRLLPWGALPRKIVTCESCGNLHAARAPIEVYMLEPFGFCPPCGMEVRLRIYEQMQK